MDNDTFSLSVINQWNNDSLDMLYSRYYKALVVYAAGYVSDPVIAEDVVQDAFTSLWQRKPVFGSVVQLRVYIYNAVRNGAISIIRRSKNEEGILSIHTVNEDILPEESMNDDSVFSPEVYRYLLSMIEKLPARQREVFLLAMEGKRNSDIAQQLEISLNTVKVLKNRALNTLRNMVDSDNIGVITLLTMIQMI